MTAKKRPEDLVGQGKGGGAPTKYKPEYCERLIEYFSGPLFETIDGKRVARSFPMFAEFATDIGVTPETLRNWAAKNGEFSKVYEQAKEYQELTLVKGAMGGHYNTVFSIFFAKNNLGYRDKQEIEQTGSMEFKGTSFDGMTREEAVAHMNKTLEKLTPAQREALSAQIKLH